MKRGVGQRRDDGRRPPGSRVPPKLGSCRRKDTINDKSAKLPIAQLLLLTYLVDGLPDDRMTKRGGKEDQVASRKFAILILLVPCFYLLIYK